MLKSGEFLLFSVPNQELFEHPYISLYMYAVKQRRNYITTTSPFKFMNTFTTAASGLVTVNVLDKKLLKHILATLNGAVAMSSCMKDNTHITVLLT